MGCIIKTQSTVSMTNQSVHLIINKYSKVNSQILSDPNYRTTYAQKYNISCVLPEVLWYTDTSCSVNLYQLRQFICLFKYIHTF